MEVDEIESEMTCIGREGGEGIHNVISAFCLP